MKQNNQLLTVRSAISECIDVRTVYDIFKRINPTTMR